MKVAPISRPSGALVSFESVLDSGGRWLNWIDESERFHAILKDKVPWDNLDGESIALVQKKLKTPQPELRLLLNSLYLTMASAFEEFLRAKIQETVSQLSAQNIKYEELNEVVRKLHLRESAKLLRRLDSPPEYLAITIEEICAAIGSCVPGSVAVKLCDQALGDVDGLIRLENFMNRMSELGKKMTFDTLAVDTRVAASFKLAGASTRSLSKSLKSCVETVSRNRNRIAHMGGTASDVDRTLLEEHRNVLKAVAYAICDIG